MPDLNCIGKTFGRPTNEAAYAKNLAHILT